MAREVAVFEIGKAGSPVTLGRIQGVQSLASRIGHSDV